MVLDKNKVIRLVLISVGFFVYWYAFKPKIETQPLVPPVSNTGHTISSLDAMGGSSQVVATPFSAALQGEEKYVTVENDLFKVVLSSKGGTIKKVVLKKYKDKNGQALVLLDEQSSNIGLSFSYKNVLIETKDLYFKTEANAFYKLKEGEQAKVVFRLELNPSQYLEQSFIFAGNSYQINYDWRTVGVLSADAPPVYFCWNMDMKSLETDYKADASRSTVHYYLLDETFEKLKESSIEVEKKKIETPIKWVSLKQRFFSSAVIAQDAFATGKLRMRPTPSTDVTKSVDLSLVVSGDQNGKPKFGGKLIFFFGPNDYQILKKVTKGFEQNIPLGWPVVKSVNQWLIMPLFSFLEKYFSNYGLVIFLLVIIIKLCLAPLSYKSFISMAKMQFLKPELDKIKDKYKNDLQKAQIEQVAFYREFGINPLSGCIPILLQMPILMAMFHFFPHAIALRQASFLWANDLSTYDSVMRLPFTIPVYGNHVSLFTLLMVLSTILYTRSNNQSAPKEGPMKGLSYIMPFAFMFVLNTFPAGLSFYYCISNVMTFLQQKLISYWVNPDSIKEKLVARQRKPKQAGKLSFKSRVAAAIETNNKKNK